MVVPQALAYASIAGLPSQYGLYASFMGCFVYVLLGSSKDITLGPTAIMSLLTAKSSQQVGGVTVPAHAIFLSFMAGVFQVGMGILRLGFLVDFISFPVINGFTTSAAITIGFGQVKSLFGLHGVRRPFLECVHDTFAGLDKTIMLDLGVGCAGFLILMLLKEWKARHDKKAGAVAKIAWFLGTARNAVVVILAGLFAYGMLKGQVVQPCHKKGPFDRSCITVVGDLPGGLPSLEAPDLGLAGDLISSAFVCAMIGYLESIAIGKAFARQNNYKIDQSQELVAIGGANILSSFFQSYPITGSFSRTAVNSASGVHTPLGGSITGLVVILALQYMTSLFYYIPQSALASIIISSVVTMVDYESPIIMWKVNPIDLIPYLLSFWLCLILDIKYGILAGVAANVCIVMYFTARPGHDLLQRSLIPGGTNNYEPTKYYAGMVEHLPNGVAVIRLNGDLFFPGVANLKDMIEELHAEVKFKALVLDFAHVQHIDFTAATGMLEIVELLQGVDATIAVCNLHIDVSQVLSRNGALGAVVVCIVRRAAIVCWAMFTVTNHMEHT
ncbi:uncharacterized protein MONBRDRAFT_25685 [Monosiga brevicollis MX1]|uniref:STAS domain-containing protein n=1 Tax=Monosiga brevicollis TaxID=81824 RepID=A9V046_MONBE|nr:uncharacterized protein MONBRDRAFT_25685 [Monosiga brevicollis MX1]EDQ89093.1 predicted protein [Monosiga brevicollis MX1]|eukprot:XP_001746198.1 hypothetical protein [Monosiga brevicollis MX1]